MRFEEVLAINVNDHAEKKKNGSTELTYLSWSWAWAEFKKIYPNATYEIKTFYDADSVEKPYMYDQNTGYLVMTSVTVDGLTHDMWLPVMDGANKAMKAEPYEYSTKFGIKTVEAATMFDVNKAIMRCLTKNLAMFGLGLYIYAGEDLPEGEENPKKEKTDFEKDATKAATQATKAMNKAVAAKDESLVKPAQYKGTISERYAKAMETLDKYTKKTFKDAARTLIDALNDLEDDLKEQGCQQWLENIIKKRNELADIETGNFH